MKNPNSEYRDDRTWLPDYRYECKTAYNLFLAALETEAESSEQMGIVLSIARRYSYLDIGGNERKRQLTDLRHWFIWWFRHAHPSGFSLAQIGQMVGNRDHSTVIHSLRKIKTAQFDHFTLGRFVAEWVDRQQIKMMAKQPANQYDHAAQF